MGAAWAIASGPVPHSGLTAGRAALAVLALIVPMPAHAQQDAEPPPRSRTIGGPPPGPCVAVDIAGYRAGDAECATQALQEAARAAQRQARAAIDTPVAEAGSPDVAVGVSSLSGSRLRMGNALGNSVRPQRPNRPPAPPRPGGRP